MEALRKVALAYYNSGTDEERRLFNQFFQSMDKDGNRRVSYREFSDFMSQKAHDENMRTRDFFNQLDIDGSGRLDFKEVLTLYYILKSRRPICGRCRIFITNEYFACMSQVPEAPEVVPEVPEAPEVVPEAVPEAPEVPEVVPEAPEIPEGTELPGVGAVILQSVQLFLTIKISQQREG
ncbi:hypothetical protein WN943_028702 [Citrus x changshan-huyou]